MRIEIPRRVLSADVAFSYHIIIRIGTYAHPSSSAFALIVSLMLASCWAANDRSPEDIILEDGLRIAVEVVGFKQTERGVNVLLVSGRRKPNSDPYFIFPKGGLKQSEKHHRFVGALREAKEEAGIGGELVVARGDAATLLNVNTTYEDEFFKVVLNSVKSTRRYFYLMDVKNETQNEEDRQVKWVSNCPLGSTPF
jgi:8-oxo-dGTP pyrophosphatase MutT (NUDIX family)